MTSINGLRSLMAGSALLLTTVAPALAAGFDGAIKNNALALSPDGRTAAVSNSEESRVLVYDVTAGKLVRTLDGFVTPRNIVFAPDGARFYVSDSST
ncbi:beta-propeller fold lactonase family protein, partial